MISFPAAAYADEGDGFWSDPLGSIASFFGFGDSTDAPEPYAAGDESTVADPSTINDWQKYLLNEDGHATTENIGRIWNDKSVSTGDVTLTGGSAGEIKISKPENADFLIGLSSLSSTSNLISTQVISKPLDIVLVLDNSTSMTSSQLNQLKIAAKNFTSSVAAESTFDAMHRVALVTFAGGASTALDLTDCTSDNLETINNAIDRISTRGGSSEYVSGINRATQLLAGSSSDRVRVELIIGDGDPGGMGNFNPEWTGKKEANQAITAAGSSKRSGIHIYSVGIFGDADSNDVPPDPNNASIWNNVFMHEISSNYPSAADLYNAGERAEDSNYYYTGTNYDELDKILEEVLQSITSSAASGSPTEVGEGAQGTSGYITFEDKLDDYMRIEGDTVTAVYADQVFIGKKAGDGTYRFEGAVDGNGVYESADMSHLIVKVADGSSLSEGDTVTVKIPAELIPLRKFQIDTDNGTMSVTEAYPIRVFYGVSLKSNVAEALKTNNAAGVISSDEYGALKRYADARIVDGKAAAFYSNDWVSGDAGSTVASFNPSSANSFYFFTKDTSVFKDASCQQRASVDDVKNGETYYQQTYYESDGNGGYSVQTKTNTLQPNFVEFSQAYWGTDDQGVYIKAGASHLTRANDFFTSKDNNPTGTATNAQNPTWAEGNKTMNSRLGNNGRLLVELPGTLSVTKNITADAGLDTSQFNKTDFTFDIEVKDASGTAVNGTFPAEVKNAEDKVVSDSNFMLKFENGKAQHSIKPNETLCIYGLTAGWTYTVTEVQGKMPAGFTQTSPEGNGSVTGRIAVNAVATAVFTNNYSVTSLDYDTSDDFQVQKVLDGRDWRDSDSFTFKLTPANDAPAANPSEAKVTKGSVDHKASFGKITFTKPGDYVYTIEEDDDKNPIIGIDYSAAKYQVTIKVVDTGDGSLKVDSVALKQIDNDEGMTLETPADIEGGVATFTNEYLSDAGTTTIKGTKSYIDNSGGKPLANNMFSFEMKAKGGFLTGAGSSENLTIGAEAAPMPEGSAGGMSTVTNTMDGFTFPTIFFNGDNVGNTYVYEVREVIPDDAVKNEDDTYTLNGMTYDATVHTLEIAVTEQNDPDDPGHAHIVAMPNMSPEQLAFTNSYDAVPVILSGGSAIQGTKTLNGRDMNAGEFEFRLVPTGATLKAVEDGIVGGISEDGLTTTAPAAENGQAAGFTFDGITFNKVGIYTFDMTEVAPAENENGLTLDKHTGKVIVKVTLDAAQAKLVASVEYGEGNHSNAFVNTYAASMDYGAAGGLNVTKTLSGRAMNAGEFSFTINGVDADDSVSADEANAKLSEADKSFSNPTNANDGAAITMNKLAAVTFSQDDAGKAFTYEVKESAGTAGGVAYDDTVYTVSIQVVDDGSGTMHTVTTVTSSKGGDPVVIDSSKAGGAIPTVAFTNTYKAGPVTLPGSENFQGTKTIDGRNGLVGETFEFTMVKGDATDGGDWSAVTTEDGKVFDKATATATMHTDKVSASYWFDDLAFAKAGTYTFNVTETGHNGKALPADGTNAMTYDRHTGTITVVVTDDGTGKLTATATMGSSADGKSIDFVNKYAPESVTYGSADELLGGDKFMNDQTGGFVFADGQFTFVMRGQAADVPMPEGLDVKQDGQGRPIVSVQSTRVNDDQGAYDFGEIVFEHSDMAGATDKGNGVFEKAFQYNIFEGDSTVPGVTQDNTAYTVTFTVTEDHNTGVMNVAASAVKIASGGGENQPVGMDQLGFTNTHDATKISGYQNIFKTIEGRDFQAGDEFVWDISMTAVDEYGKPMLKDQLPTVDDDISEPGADPSAELSGLTYTDNGDGFSYTATIKPAKTQTGNTYRFSTGKITYEHVGTYTYTVKERASRVAGVTSDTAVYTVVVEITEENGALKRVSKVTPEPSANGTLDFTNTYAATGSLDGAANLAVTKVLEGRNWSDGSDGVPADSFQFALAAGDDTTQTAIDTGTVKLPDTTTVTVDHATADHKAAFGNIEFTKAGEFSFKVTEALPEDDDAEAEGIQKNGVTYDESVKTVIVSVVDNLDGTLTVTVTEGANPTFTNKYDSDPASVGTEAMFDLTKQLTGREGNAWADGDSFEFTLAGNDGAPMPADAENGSKTVTVTKNDVTDAANGIAKIDFGDIAYEATGTYTYTVVETNAGKTINGVTHASNTVTVTVTVKDNGVGGLVAAVAKTGESKNEAGEGASFVNTYSSTVNYGDVGGVDVTKVLKDRDMTAGQFTFTVTSEDKAALDKIGGKGMTMESAAAKAAAASVTGNPFNGIAFDRNDSGKDFVYTIDEVQEGGNGYTCDTSVYTVTITPHDNGDGTMSITTVVEDSDGEHSMTVENATADRPQTALVPFDNTYAADPVVIGAEGDAAIVAHKTLKNDDIANYAGEFNFVVTSGDVTVATGTNAADGTVTFDNIEYTSANLYAAAHGGSDEVGTATLTVKGDVDEYKFNYSVAEDAMNLPKGVSYESGKGTAIVAVTDNRAGELSISVAYDNGGNGFEFVNVYGAGEQAQLTLTGNKSIVGLDGAIAPALTDGMFGFTIAGSEGAPMPDVTYVENSGATVAFGPIAYTMENVFGAAANAGADAAADESAEAGVDGAADAETAAEGIEPYTAGRTKTFTYIITEDASKTVSGVTNDATAKTVEVTVTDNGDGTLTAAVTKVSEGTAQGMDFSFVNTYAVAPIEKTPTVEGGLTITKVWDKQSGSRELAEGDFSFAMLDADGNVVSQGTNDADGNVAMSPVKYTAEGEYTYELIEVVPEDAKPVEGGYEKDGVLYVANSYAVTANVIDNHDGTLGITWTMKAEDGTETDTAEFVNIYSVNPTTVTFGAAKSLEGRAMKAGEFEFELKDADGKVLGTAKNAADGSIVFADAIQTFGNAGEYDFTVSEVLPNDDDSSKDGIQKEGVTYDETIYAAHVVTTDDGKGNLQITELTYDGKAELPVFHNSYVEPAVPEEPIVTPDPEEPTFAQTNDSTPWTIVLGVAVVALAGVALGAVGLLRARRR